MKHQIEYDQVELKVRYKVMGRILVIETPVSVRDMMKPERLFAFLDEKVDQYIRQDALDNAPKDLQ